MQHLSGLPLLTERPHELLIQHDPPTYQNAWEWARLQELYRLRRPATVLEVGTYWGGTLRGWLAAEWRPLVVSVDLPPAPHARPVARWQAWAAESGATLHLSIGDSRHPATVAQARAHAPYDWVYIDGGHEYETVALDWRHYGALCRPGGVVVFHDINPRDGYGVSVLWEEIRRAGYVTQEINAGEAGMCGIGVVFV